MKFTKTYLTLFSALLTLNLSDAGADFNADIESILNWGEKTYPQYLTNHDNTKILDQWHYRFYAATRLYAGINSQDKGVYVLSGVPGSQPWLFGSVTDLLKTVNRSGPPVIAGCEILPADNVWNTPIDTLPVHANSSAWIAAIGADTGFHMDFGSGKWEGNDIGIPYNVVNASQEPNYTFNFLYDDESDAGPYPIAANSRIEEGNDHHLITLDQETCILYEIYNATRNNGWVGDSGAIWNLKSNALRPIGWTSADAAGLPILPGLVRYDEIAAGEIKHALRFTVEQSNSYIWPGSHLTDGTPGELTNQPPMGARFRLKADYDISRFDPKLQVILKAMKTYGIINADNGSSWFVSGVPDSRWDNELLSQLGRLQGSAFEAVDESCMRVSADSAKADLSKC